MKVSPFKYLIAILNWLFIDLLVVSSAITAKATPTDTCDMTDFGKEEIFTLTEITAAIRGLKSEKVAGEDKIRPEMLKTLNVKRVR